MELYINRWAFWAPPCDNQAASPPLDYVPPLLKRRLSQLTRMTIEVVHQVLDAAPESGLVFVSSGGESARQLQVDRMLIEDGGILPAPFSLSVFNASPAMATIALGMKGGYTALFPAQNLFQEGLVYGAAPVMAGETESAILVFADQQLPAEYMAIASPEDIIPPYVASFVLSSVKQPGGMAITLNPEAACIGEAVPYSSLEELITMLKGEASSV
ncbi:MAG: beta-ketoacyl synthase chain length factor [Spirochaetia bacterium]|nr:beta-ketoacyl synthase chain length factor [Spirochaetia bacterium]